MSTMVLTREDHAVPARTSAEPLRTRGEPAPAPALLGRHKVRVCGRRAGEKGQKADERSDDVLIAIEGPAVRSAWAPRKHRPRSHKLSAKRIRTCAAGWRVAVFAQNACQNSAGMPRRTAPKAAAALRRLARPQSLSAGCRTRARTPRVVRRANPSRRRLHTRTAPRPGRSPAWRRPRCTGSSCPRARRARARPVPDCNRQRAKEAKNGKRALLPGTPAFEEHAREEEQRDAREAAVRARRRERAAAVAALPGRRSSGRSATRRGARARSARTDRASTAQRSRGRLPPSRRTSARARPGVWCGGRRRGSAEAG